MECESAQHLSCRTNAQCVLTQCMYATRPLKSTSSVVSCFMVCLLVYASFQFTCDAVVLFHFVLIALLVPIVFM